MEIYLDNAATTQTSEEAAKKALYIMTQCYGNPSSMHKFGFEAEKEISNCAQIISNSINSSTDEIYFTSGGTESNNIAIFGTALGYYRSGKHIVTTKIEHPAVLQPFKFLEQRGFEVTYLDVNSDGMVDNVELKNSVREDTILVSIMHVNNEMGALQDIESIGKIIKKSNPNTLFHVDAVQSFGKYNISVNKYNIDIMSMSGHKLHSPKGVGAVYIKKNLKVKPIIYGGGQQKNMRSGTENVSGIAAFAVATERAYQNMDSNYLHVKNLKHKLAYGILNQIDGTSMNGNFKNSSPYILNISFEGIKSEVLLHSLEIRGISVSSGSACSSNRKQLSSTLQAIGTENIEGAIRFSFSNYNTDEQIEFCINSLKEEIYKLRRFKRS